MDKAQTRYKQCRLWHPATRRARVAWIPNQLAKRTQILEIEDEDGWVVNDVFKGTIRTFADFTAQHNAGRRFQQALGG